MSWTETHERFRIIREVVEAAEADPTGTLPWREEYADLFGDRDGLVTALRQRWQRTCEAQLDPNLSEEQMTDHHRRLLRQNAAMLRILDSYVSSTSVPAAAVAPVA
jgi:hypothetical protein